MAGILIRLARPRRPAGTTGPQAPSAMPPKLRSSKRHAPATEKVRARNLGDVQATVQSRLDVLTLSQARPVETNQVCLAALGADGVLQREMMLAAYLSTVDLLHLSTVTQWLKPFRFHLDSLDVNLSVRRLGAAEPVVVALIASLLGEQRRIRRLRIQGGWLVEPLLTALQGGPSRCKTIVELDLYKTSAPALESFAAALTSGAFPLLTVLKIQGDWLLCHSLAQAVRARELRGLRELHLECRRPGAEMMEALADGGCPLLALLHLTDFNITPAFSDAFARAVRGGSLARLEVLDMENGQVTHGVTEPMLEALGEGGCPSLHSLRWKTRQGWPRLAAEEWLPVFRGIAERRLCEIRRLDFSDQPIGSDCVAALMEAMAEGHELEELVIGDPYPYGGPPNEQDLLALVSSLKQLEIQANERSTPSVLSCQIQAIRAGGGLRMRKLSLTGRKAAMTDQACAALADALAAGACPDLKVLSLHRTGMGPLAALRLARAIEDKSLLRLERLDVGMSEIDPAGATALAAAIGAGGLPELKWADFSWCRFGPTSADALYAAMIQGCPRILAKDRSSIRTHREYEVND
jgi:hypothetical protein